MLLLITQTFCIIDCRYKNRILNDEVILVSSVPGRLHNSNNRRINGEKTTIDDYILPYHVPSSPRGQIHSRPGHLLFSVQSMKFRRTSGISSIDTHVPPRSVGTGATPLAIRLTCSLVVTVSNVISDAKAPGAIVFTRTGMFFSIISVESSFAKCEAAAFELL